MKKLFLVLCVLIMFFGIVGCPTSNDPATQGKTSSTISQSVTSPGMSSPGENTSPVPEPATLILLGTGLVSLGVLGRKRFKK